MIAPYVEEFVGTFMFTSVIGWALINNQRHGGEIGFTGAAIGLALMVCVYITGGHSGGHLNPAVSLAVFLSSSTFHSTRKIDFTWKMLLGYWFMQFAAAFTAGGACYAMYGHDRPSGVYGGFPKRGEGVDWYSGMLTEMMGTCTLCLTVLGVATSRPVEEGGGGSANAGNSTFGLAIGGAIIAWAYAGGDISGGAYNGAVATLPAVWGHDDDIGMYYVGEGLGAVLAFMVFYITHPIEFSAEGHPIANACMLIKNEFNEFFGTLLFCTVISLCAGNSKSVGASWGVGGGLPIGVMLMVIVYMGGHVSGGHYNPAVTLGVTLRGKHSVLKMFTYWVAQGTGAICGGYIAKGLADPVGDSDIGYGYPSFGNTNSYNVGDANTWEGVTHFYWAQAFGAETIGTMILVSAVLFTATTEKKNINNSFYGISIGFAVVISAYAFGPVSGGAFNPAVGLLGIVQADGYQMSQIVSCYWSGPFFGAIFAAFFFWLCNPDESYDHSLGDVQVYLYAEEGGGATLGHASYEGDQGNRGEKYAEDMGDVSFNKDMVVETTVVPSMGSNDRIIDDKIIAV
jgi:aquaporin Z